MKTLIARIVFDLAGVLPACVLVPVAHGEVPIFYSGYTLLTPTGQGSYVHSSVENPPAGYTKQPGLTVGESWTMDGQNHTVEYFDRFRAFVVFDVPRYKGIVTREEIGIPDWAVPDVTQLRTKVLGADILIQQVREDELGHDSSPLEFRWSSLPAATLTNGTIDPKAAFNGLLSGPRVERELNWFYLTDSPTGFSLNDSFTNFLNNTDGGPVVFSITMPFVGGRETLDLKYLTDVTLNITYDGYASLTPVPEPAAYSCAGAVMCAALALRRTVKSRMGKRNRVIDVS